jgi:hypothetical protein
MKVGMSGNDIQEESQRESQFKNPRVLSQEDE